MDHEENFSKKYGILDYIKTIELEELQDQKNNL